LNKEDKGKKKEVFVPGIILDDEGEEIYYELTGSKCSRCPLKGICG